MYLENVITHMLRGTAKTEELLPDRWRAAHPEAVREYREQERQDKADTAVTQAAQRWVRLCSRELGKEAIRIFFSIGCLLCAAAIGSALRNQFSSVGDGPHGAFVGEI
jgi:hypothetical protein